MAAKLEELLRTRGYSDADLQMIAPLLADERFRSTLEATYGELETERDTLKDLNGQWQEKLEKEYNPAITNAEKQAAEARLEAARLREQVKIARDFGYLTDDNAPEVNKTEAAIPNPEFDPKKHNLVTHRDIATYADVEGQAIAMAADLAMEYQTLFGKPLYEHAFQTRDGRTLRGMTALREEWKATGSKGQLYDFVSSKFKFADKHAEIEAARQQERDKRIADEAVGKYVAQHGGNPHTTTAMPSNSPYIPRPADKAGLPWGEGKSPDQLRAARLERARQAQISGSVQ